jgi:hypothetical protein
MKRALIAILASALCVAMIPAAAIAGKKVVSEISVSNPQAGVYTGTVTSQKKKCQGGRNVEVWHDTNGNGQIDGEPTDYLIGTATTASDGTYTVSGDQAPIGDNIIASVARKKSGRKNCGGAQTVASATGGV